MLQQAKPGRQCRHCDSVLHGSSEHYGKKAYPGHVYCASVPSLGKYSHKIGQTGNLDRRLTQLGEIHGAIP